MKINFEKPVAIGFGITIVVLAILGIFSFSSTQRLISTSRLLSHALSIISHADQIQKVMVDMETGQRGYVISGDESFLHHFNDSPQSLTQHLKKLDSLMEQDPVQQKKLDTLKVLIQIQQGWNERVLEARKVSFEEARDLIATRDGKRGMDSLRSCIKHIQAQAGDTFRQGNTITGKSLLQFQYSFIGLSAFITLTILFLFYMINRTLSARNKVESKLKVSLNEIHDLYNNAPCGYLSVDHTIFLTNINSTLLRWTGYTEQEVIGKMKFEDLLTPESRQAFLASFEKDFETFKQHGVVVDLEFDFLRKDGTSFPVIVNSAAQFDEEGRFIKSRSNVFDNTERKKTELQIRKLNSELESKVEERTRKLSESEKIYKTIASNIPGSVIVILDQEERYLLAEGDMLQHMGYRREDLLHSTLRERTTEERYQLFRPLFQKAFQGQTVTREIKTLSGADTLMKITPLRGEDDAIFAVMLIMIDITEIKKVQSELAVLNNSLEIKVARRTEQLNAVNKELESFTYSVSHDLRSPLRGITGYAQILQEDHHDKLDEDAHRAIASIIRNATRMGQLIDDLLDFSRLGRTELATVAVDMNKVVQEIVHEQTAHENPDRLTITVLPLPGVRADVSMIRQVWTNLISNALKYSRHKPVALIEIGATSNDGTITYYIRDNGAGFDMLYVNKLFGVFQRLHKASEFEGTGVGLALVNTIIKRHGGHVGAEGKLNEGARFYFTLPINKP